MSDLENTLQEVLNFNLPVFQIDEDGDLKFLFYYQTEVMPAINDTIVNMIQEVPLRVSLILPMVRWWTAWPFVRDMPLHINIC